ncbi:hypothetical protein AltI4_16850 [Alteromonas sp. I4]|nr:hypothetical protein AltI4_16850 [Alteromonas sp. I4]
MDQTELGLRVGVGRNTISSIENGKPVNSETLFKVLEHFGLLDDLHALIEQQYITQNNSLARKSRKGIPELDNNF